ncbi:MAG TPA: hypothetical protein PK367_03445 [Candidatus Paceibacterota bacterium]|jgi:hypothetical protein|nr:hypothetical protein [Candidatus Paceibacterota bacterium]HPW67657.1 hypothetical protein [Salinivirgaceae bacterium]
MKRILFFLFSTLSLVVYGQGADHEVISNTLTDKHISVEGTKMSLILPDGFDKSDNFNGFQQNEKSLSIVVIESPGPFSEITKALKGI